MGYTHYYYQKPALDGDKFKVFASDCIDIVKEAIVQGTRIVGWDGDAMTDPEFTESVVQFNGYKDEAHETFAVSRATSGDCPDEQGRLFSFCKTARKPYDAAVCACLIALKHHFGDDVAIHSDGDEGDWEEGKQLYRDVTGREVINALDREPEDE